MRMNRTLALSLLFAGALSATSAVAEDSVTKKESEKDNAIKVYVTASRGVEQSELDVAQTTDSVTKEELGSAEYPDVDDALRNLPNVSLAPAEGNPNYWQEGFSLRGLGAQRVLTLSDGIRQAGQGIGYGGGNLSLYDPYGIEKIEVLRGPASVLYGTDAFGGVVNIITREPKRRTEAGHNGGIRYGYDGSRDLNRVSGYLDAGDKDVSTLISTSIYNSDRPNLPDDADADQGSYRGFGLNGKVDFYLENKTKVRLIGNVNDNRDILVSDSSISLPIATFGAPGTFEMITAPLYFTFPKYARSMAGAEVSQEDVSENVKLLKTSVYWQQIARLFHRETTFYSNGSPGFAGPPTFIDPTSTVTKSTVDTDDKTNTVEWQNQAKIVLGGDHTLTSGIDFGYDMTNDPETETQQVLAQAGFGPVTRPDVSVERTRAKADQYRIGAYTQDTIAVASDVEVIPGVRFDYYSVNDDLTSFDDSAFGVSGGLGSVYHTSSTQSVYANVTTGFRAPDLGERFQDGIVNLGAPSRIIGKADLDPERAWGVEAGTKNRSGRFSYDFATFGNFIRDYIGTSALGVVDGFSTEQYDNIGNVTLYGGEASTSYDVTDNFKTYANIGRTWTRDATKVDVPNWTLNYGAKYVQPVNSGYVKAVTPGINFRTVLKSYDKTTGGGGARSQFEGDGFTVADLFLNVELGKSSLGEGKIVSGIRNLFNRDYKEPFFNVLQPERSGYVGVEFSF